MDICQAQADAMFRPPLEHPTSVEGHEDHIAIGRHRGDLGSLSPRIDDIKQLYIYMGGMRWKTHLLPSC